MTLPLLRMGWQPKRSYSLSAILARRLPVFILYLNAYYITGIQKAVQPLLCKGDSGLKYLRASPDMRCWQGEHSAMIAFDVVAWVLYLSLPFTCARQAHNSS